MKKTLFTMVVILTSTLVVLLLLMYFNQEDKLLPQEILSTSVGGILVLIGTLFTSYIESIKESDIREQEEVDFRELIKVDLKSLWGRYYETMGKVVEDLAEGDCLGSRNIAEEDYFVIYNNNTDKLILINDLNLREKIIVLYTKIKGLLDTLRLNNQLITLAADSSKLEITDYNNQAKEMCHQIYKERQFKNINDIRTELAKDIKQEHCLIESIFNEVIFKL